MAYKNDLIKQIPIFQQTSVPLEQYAQAAGEVFDDISNAIDSLKYNYDYAHVKEENLDNLSALFDLKFFANLNEYGRRKFAKDAAKLYKKLGTEQALKYIFKIIGIKVEVEKMWMLAPVANANDITYLYNGTLQYHEADVGQYYHENGSPSPVAPLQLINGKSKVYDNGVYVDLYYGSEKFAKWKIYGEEYDAYIDDSKFSMIKVPYYYINIIEESYNLYTDVDGDGSLDYLDQEKINLAKELVEYTLGEYLGANEVVLGTRLADLNIDVITNDLVHNDNDFQLTIDPKNSNENRVSAYTIPSGESIPYTLELKDVTTLPSIASAEIFGDVIVRWNTSITFNSIVSIEQFGNTNIFNALLYVNGMPSITTQEVFGTPAIPFAIEPQGIVTTEAFEVDTNIVLSQFIENAGNIYAIDSIGYASVTNLLEVVSGVTIDSTDIVETPVYVYTAGSQFITGIGEVAIGEIIDNNHAVLRNDTTVIASSDITSTEGFEIDTKLTVGGSLIIGYSINIPQNQISQPALVKNVNATLITSTSGVISAETLEINNNVLQAINGFDIASAEAFDTPTVV